MQTPFKRMNNKKAIAMPTTAQPDPFTRTHSSSWLLIVATLSFLCGLALSKALGLEPTWPSHLEMVSYLDNPINWLRWLISDISEYAFYKHELASLGLLAGAALAWWAGRRGRRWQGFAICYNSGLWPWLMISSLLGLVLSNLLWSWTVNAEAWQPTYVAFISVPAAMVLVFGPGWRVALNGAVCGAVLVPPLCLAIIHTVCLPLNLPVMVGTAAGMAIASVMAFFLCWLLPDRLLARNPQPLPPAQAPEQSYGLVWGVRRVLADFSEAPLLGNELASLGLLAGVLLGYALNPDSTAHGSGLLLPIMAGQFLASAIGVWLWREQWMIKGWYPTFIPIVSVVPATVMTHGGNALVVTLSATLGALIAPPLASVAARRLPDWVHPYVANVVSMALSTALIVPLMGLLIAQAS